jgi:hypothetical protein
VGLDRRQNQDPGNRFDRVHETAVVECDRELVGLEAREKGALAGHVPAAVAGAVRENRGAGGRLGFGLETARRNLCELVRGEGRNLVEDVPLGQLSRVEEPGDAIRDLLSPESPDFMAARVGELMDLGVSIIGGCCGTTPAHIRAIRSAIDARQ